MASNEMDIPSIDNQVEVVGFEDDFKTLKAELNSEDMSLKVISVHGMGGLDKTSLATKLYNYSELRNFDTHAKVCVSNEFDMKNVLKRIVKSFTGPEHEKYLSTMDEHDLLQYLPKLLEDRGRYLALIDDIWNIKAWIQIKDAFPDQKNGSRIIVEVVGFEDDFKTLKAELNSEDLSLKVISIHGMGGLGKTSLATKLYNSSELRNFDTLAKRAEPTIQNLKKLGKEMVSKCRGLPLAIVVLSGHLSHNMSYDYWSKVKEHIWRHLKDDDLSPQIGEILSLSFNDLSPQMKDCFLYLARYPEDHVIDPDELKHLWIAEEFISEAEEGEGVIMEDLAEDCLKELIDRNLLQVNDLRWNGEVKSFRVHDLVRDLSIKKAKENKLLVVLDSGKHHPERIHLLEGQPRHVIYNEIGEYLKLVDYRFDALRLHSLTVGDYSDDPIEIPASIGKLKKLQTLHGGRRTYYTVPRENIDLSLRESQFTEDPMPTLGSFSNLTALELDNVYMDNVYRGNKMVCSENGFRSLQILKLDRFLNLEELEVGDGAFPSLKQFQTVICRKLKNIPVQLAERLSFTANSYFIESHGIRASQASNLQIEVSSVHHLHFIIIIIVN
ncbi:hypothetical protein AgCh_023714 [Apium graveolens]